jgi:2,3-bisphosphoglycerate-dependent phosphoglycerate mutase
MNHAYNGKVKYVLILELLKEVHEIHELLQNYIPSQVIWDNEDLTKQPPWGANISPEITSLANYFVTSEGTDFFKVLIAALEQAIKYKVDFEVESL